MSSHSVAPQYWPDSIDLLNARPAALFVKTGVNVVQRPWEGGVRRTPLASQEAVPTGESVGVCGEVYMG